MDQVKPLPARFGGIDRLYGRGSVDRLAQAHVCVIGIGGVGAWVCEALVRSGVGQLTLVDLDDVCVTNVNRQIHALDSTIGHPKVEAMGKRLLDISPDCRVTVEHAFLSEKNLDSLLGRGYDYVVDAIDHAKVKCQMLTWCRHNKQRILTIGGAGGRKDPTLVQVSDLSRTINDPLLAKVRKQLRQSYGWPREGRRFRVAAVFSPEEISYPQADGSVLCKKPDGGNLRLDCATGYGTASYVTGTFGFVAAAHIVKQLTA